MVRAGVGFWVVVRNYQHVNLAIFRSKSIKSKFWEHILDEMQKAEAACCAVCKAIHTYTLYT